MQWNWNSLGEEVERARRACVPAGTPGHHQAAQRFHRAVAAAWPPGFFDQLQRCKRGDPDALDDVLDFVEACPRFFRTGYILDKALRWLPRPPRSETQVQRMRGIVLAAAGRRLRLPLRPIFPLAVAVDSPGLRDSLRSLAESDDVHVRERAMAVLDRLPGPAWNAPRRRLQRADDRVGTMVVTARNRKSPTLLRKALAVDPRQLTSRGRSYLAAAFEFTMNWGLVPDRELLEIARSIDGPEMEPIWRWALSRSDPPGDRARWLLAQLPQR